MVMEADEDFGASSLACICVHVCCVKTDLLLKALHQLAGLDVLVDGSRGVFGLQFNSKDRMNRKT